MSTPAETYIFSDAEWTGELARLRQLEAVFDDDSRRVLRGAGLAPGQRCLEIGAGAGSIAEWLVTEVGPGGSVVAIDVDTRLLTPKPERGLHVVKCDVREYESELVFDLIHARYALVHVAEPEKALARMLRCLAPGGRIVLEEPDFPAARAASGPAELLPAFERLNVAISRLFIGRGLNPAFGLRLPRDLQALGLTLSHVENDAPLVPGGSGLAMMMRSSAESLSAKYVATGAVSAEDVQAYCRFAADPLTWAIYYGTVRISAQNPG